MTAIFRSCFQKSIFHLVITLRYPAKSHSSLWCHRGCCYPPSGLWDLPRSRFYLLWQAADSLGLFLMLSAYYSFSAECSLDHKTYWIIHMAQNRIVPAPQRLLELSAGSQIHSQFKLTALGGVRVRAASVCCGGNAEDALNHGWPQLFSPASKSRFTMQPVKSASH